MNPSVAPKQEIFAAVESICDLTAAYGTIQTLVMRDAIDQEFEGVERFTGDLRIWWFGNKFTQEDDTCSVFEQMEKAAARYWSALHATVDAMSIPIVSALRNATDHPARVPSPYDETSLQSCWPSYFEAAYYALVGIAGMIANSAFTVDFRLAGGPVIFEFESEPQFDDDEFVDQILTNLFVYNWTAIRDSVGYTGLVDTRTLIEHLKKEAQRATGDYPVFGANSSQAHAAKLSHSTFRAIELLKAGLDRSQVAERLGTSPNNVSQIKSRYRGLLDS